VNELQSGDVQNDISIEVQCQCQYHNVEVSLTKTCAENVLLRYTMKCKMHQVAIIQI
jgi:hypothetical protein